MAQQTMQQRQAAARKPALAAATTGPVQAQLVQLAATLNGSPAVQRMGSTKKKLTQHASKKKLMQHATKRKPMQRAVKKKPMQHKAAEPIQRAENKTGLPNQLKGGIESLSGMSMDHVRVHYNSPKPAQLNAHAYAQGSDIHVAPGQQRHVPHEAWHVVQQAQGRVKPTMQLQSGVPVNDDTGLEREADRMGARAMQMAPKKKMPGK
jgi:hypothetical protein